MKHIFVINPVSGQGKTKKYFEPEIDEYFKDKNLEYSVHLTDGPLDATNFVRKTSESGEEIRFYACGGDGTLFEVVNGAYGFPNVEVASIPLGSANDFLRLFGTREDFLDLDAQVNGKAIKIDLIKCGDKVAINQCSMGFDAEACYNQAKFKKLPGVSGRMAYTMSTLYCLMKKTKNNFEIQIDDNKPVKATVMFSLAGNSRWYGGGYKCVPYAIPDDGLLDFVIVRTMPRRKLITRVGKYKRGEHPTWKETTYMRGKKMRVHSDQPATVNRDGECRKENDITFEVIEGGIKFSLPTTAKYKLPEDEGYIIKDQKLVLK